MIRSFLEAGCEVLAVGDGSEEEWSDRFRGLGARYRQIPVQRNGTNVLSDLKTLRALKALLREEKPDKIFTYQAKTVIYGGLAARQCGIDEVYPLIAGVGSVFLGSGLKKSLVRQILVSEYRWGMRHAKRVFFQNPDDVQVFVKHRIIDKERVVMLHGSGVNLDKFPVAELPDSPSFLCISRLIRDKGVAEYLEAARRIRKRHADVRCVLVGPFDTNPSALTEEDVQSYTDDGSVEYVGEQRDVYPFLRDCSAFVLPSYHEGTPKTVLEAMATGRPVITTDAPGCRETVTDGENGYLVPVKDVDAIVEAMERLLTDKQKSIEMAKRARAIAEERYDVRKVNQVIKHTMNI